MSEVIEFPSPRDHADWPYCPAFAMGTMLYGIQHGDRYFKWCYIHRDAAEYLANRLRCDYNPSNWVKTLEETCPSDKTSDTIHERRMTSGQTRE